MATSAKYGARGETTQRLSKALRSRMKVVAAMGGYKTMLEWQEAKIAEDEEKYWIVQNNANYSGDRMECVISKKLSSGGKRK